MHARARRGCAWFLLLLLSLSEAAEILQTAVLVEFDNEAFKEAVISTRTESALASAAAVVGRDARAMRRPRAAALRAAAAVPAAERLARRIVDSAKASRIRVRRYQPYGLVFEGMSLETETAADADALRDLLKVSPQVKKIYPVVSMRTAFTAAGTRLSAVL